MSSEILLPRIREKNQKAEKKVGDSMGTTAEMHACYVPITFTV